jgi:hypothetical protein
MATSFHLEQPDETKPHFTGAIFALDQLYWT